MNSEQWTQKAENLVISLPVEMYCTDFCCHFCENTDPPMNRKNNVNYCAYIHTPVSLTPWTSRSQILQNQHILSYIQMTSKNIHVFTWGNAVKRQWGESMGPLTKLRLYFMDVVCDSLMFFVLVFCFVISFML